MARVIILCLLVCCWAFAKAQPISPSEGQEWERFKTTYGKSYPHKEEELYRQQVFVNNFRSIQAHNKKYEEGKTTFTLKINKFADLTSEEFRKLYNGYKGKTPSSQVYTDEGGDLPASVDWRPKGAVTPIKNQGQCGSCWAFSATGSLEGQTFLKKGKLVSLSEQNLMDCSEDYGNEGCDGGLMDQAFDYIKDNKGIDTEESYPYEAENGKCRFKKASIGATLKSYTDVKSGSESALQSAVANVGPISVAIDAGEFSFQFYESGIYYESACSPSALDHGVLAVGYGSNNKGDYWIVKNSWGEDWGDKGYILMARNKNNNCGIATQASYPNV
uniref:Cathepsin L n=1 Tax=Riptortus pedestris TaxID=329032 RepID=R4WQK9_RIPPE|nr:cathepsin L [Riptortus pedestris]